MRFAHITLQWLLVVALTTYALDCEAMTTPEQAMRCCAEMQCARHGQMDAKQGMDCCQTMPTAQAPFMLPSFGHGLSHNVVVLAVLPVYSDMTVFPSSERTIAERNHAPPVFSPPTLQPLRI